MLRTGPCLTNTARFFFFYKEAGLTCTLAETEIKHRLWTLEMQVSHHSLLPKLAVLSQTLDTFTLAYSSLLQKCCINRLFV